MKLRVKEVEEVLTGLAHEIIRYISNQHSIVKDMLAAIHTNKIFNMKGRYETLEDINIKNLLNLMKHNKIWQTSKIN